MRATCDDLHIPTALAAVDETASSQVARRRRRAKDRQRSSGGRFPQLRPTRAAAASTGARCSGANSSAAVATPSAAAVPG